MAGEITSATVNLDKNGSLATTHTSQGSDRGLYAGLSGWDITDQRLADVQHSDIYKFDFNIEINDFGFDHPNTYRLILKSNDHSHSLTAVSTGGGSILVTEVDGLEIRMNGDYFETLIFCKSSSTDVLMKRLNTFLKFEKIKVLLGRKNSIIEIKGHDFVPDDLLSMLNDDIDTAKIHPVLPVLSGYENKVPFSTTTGMLKYIDADNRELWDVALEYERLRSGLSENEILSKIKIFIGYMQTCVDQGLAGTDFADRILGPQSVKYRSMKQSNDLLDAGILDNIICNVSAIMEVKSSWGVIVAAPTAGSCGTMAGSVLAVANELNSSTSNIAKAMLAAGLIGIFIINNATFSAEIAGCQAECGAAAAMTAAALVTLKHGSIANALDSASMALQNSLGMICDPVANRVEIPCLGKNIMAAGNALACANMALGGYQAVIPLDEVIIAMKRVGDSLPRELRCTALGGLSSTPTAQVIEEKLNEN
jgi:L-serine dehydratase